MQKMLCASTANNEVKTPLDSQSRVKDGTFLHSSILCIYDTIWLDLHWVYPRCVSKTHLRDLTLMEKANVSNGMSICQSERSAPPYPSLTRIRLLRRFSSLLNLHCKLPKTRTLVRLLGRGLLLVVDIPALFVQTSDDFQFGIEGVTWVLKAVKLLNSSWTCSRHAGGWDILRPV